MTETDTAYEDRLRALSAKTQPILHLRGIDGDRVRLAAIRIRPSDEGAPTLKADGRETSPVCLLRRYGLVIEQYTFSLPMRADAHYEIAGKTFTVNTDFSGDLRIAFVSCDGQEHGDRDRDLGERNVLWNRLRLGHEAEPLNLILQGGDQIYADEILDAHPRTAEWGHERGDPGLDAHDEVDAMRDALSRALFERYMELFSHADAARLSAEVPTLSIWDDHDICDGWGSLHDRKLDSPVGKTVFAVAREHYLLFQMGASEAELPEHCIDRTGSSLGWHVALPGLHVIAPDLRSERRRDTVMGEKGWAALDQALTAAEGNRVLLISSVPALGPRLSLIEGLMRLTPVMEKYEDDLRDQWQSRTHRDEWKRFLNRLLETHRAPKTRLTVVSGEIHLATRATLDAPGGPIHQLVASGITHPPPPELYARTLGAFSKLGASPLKDHPIRILPLPGCRTVYMARRNYLMIVRRNDEWSAWWELHPEGATPELALE